MMKPPPLRDDCFAMPPGVDWTPVDDALARLRENMHPIKGVETCALAEASGRILARDIKALANHPVFTNTAVDGFGFAFEALSGADTETLELVEGRAAAGQNFDGHVPPGQAVRVLTGARLPDGVDTVVLEEDCAISEDRIAFRAGIKRGANTRPMGEDFAMGDVVLEAGRAITAGDMAMLSSAGVAEVEVFETLRVGVISTGDEIAGAAQSGNAIPDANRPMLLDMITRFGFEAHDLGALPDQPEQIEAVLDHAKAHVDVVITTGGASAGDEDHISALLRARGQLYHWRIALKPGRPLALATWDGMPVFGLPGNPVAAFVCTVIFAKPACDALAGRGWSTPLGFDVPAGFAKTKKPGRREYLRARVRAGQVEIFKSEGSGRVSGLSWSEGLVELSDGADKIATGDRVRFIPYSSFGL